MFEINNPWITGIVGTAIGTAIGGFLVYYFLEGRKKKALETIVTASLSEADELLAKNRSEDALAIYNDLVKAVSRKEKPEVYGHIRNNQGICYCNLALIKDKEGNLTKAIQAYEQALKIYTVEKYPVNYATTQNNLGTAYSTLAEVRDKEGNLTKAIQAYEQALKIRTVEKYPLYHKVVISNMERAKQQLKTH